MKCSHSNCANHKSGAMFQTSYVASTKKMTPRTFYFSKAQLTNLEGAIHKLLITYAQIIDTKPTYLQLTLGIYTTSIEADLT